MSSDRKIAANRNNAKKSTGPRSLVGRDASRRNARRHGLATSIHEDPAFQDDIERLAKAISQSSAMPHLHQDAREAAAAELELLRIRKIRAALLAPLDIENYVIPTNMADVNAKLAKLERYERRAFSRRKRALLEL